MRSGKFYITTPIYYVNDQPHIGHAYTSLAADVLCMFNRMLQKEVYFLTGTDEHGQKVEQAAALKGRSPKEHADAMVENFKALWEKLDLTHGAFIRTTDDEHKKIVRELLQQIYDKGEIEKRTYSGWYCTPCERFWTKKDVSEGNCPDCGRPVEEIEEENYFFLMSRYQDRLREHIESNAGFILPETRRNEVLGFLGAGPLQDLCISRPKKRLSWGVELPFDPEFVTYVWFDALINYFSGTRYLIGPEAGKGGTVPPWPADVHLIGKDILTTHAVYWITMLMAMELPLPKTIFAHGWWTIDGQKMSKSLGNVVDPADISERFGNDSFRYFLFREVPFGNDGDFSEHALINRINVDLANDLGNLASRAMKMAGKFFEGVVPEPAEVETEARDIAENIPGVMNEALQVLKFQRALDEIWKLVSYANKYIDTNAPWALAKDPQKEGRLRTVIYTCLESLRVLAVSLHPFMPSATSKLYTALGCEGDIMEAGLGSLKWGGLKPGTKLKELKNLFPRIDTKKKDSGKHKKPKDNKEKKVEEKTATDEKKDNIIKIDDVMKVELKTGVVKVAERVEGADKLLRLEVDTAEEGGELRQIVAGIAMAYEPEALVGKNIVVVTNLKPAKLRGVVSQGMLLAATGEDGKPVIVTTEKPVAPGLRVK
jgi:methionyl-tRNA synthetase